MGIPAPAMEGYLLKKKKKKMQGMARRYGALSYSFNPNSPIRDSVLVSLTFVSAARKTRTFHIDSGKGVWHMKALTEADFDKWTKALRQFVGEVGEEPEHEMGSPGVSAIIGGGEMETATAVDLSTIYDAVLRLKAPIQDLEAIQLDLSRHESHAPSPVSSPHHSHNATPSPKFKFLKKHGKETVRPDDYFDVKPNPSLGSPNGDSPLSKQLAIAIATIKAQQELLAETINRVTVSHASSTSREYSPLRTYASRSSAAFVRAPSRASSIHSGETQDFYEDALPGEFILEEEASDEEDVEEGESSGEERYSDTSFASVEEEEEGRGGHHEKEETEVEARQSGETEGEGETMTISEGMQVKRREQLPAPISGDEFSMLGMLRKNVGKDLSTISFPVTINEPLSALQRIAEELEYCELLHRAADTDDSIDRLALVATFAISGAAGNKYRTSRKPFNPLLGETYECVRADKGFKYVSEKVSHHPPVMAFHADAKGWTVEGHVAPSQKFWGRSMEVFVTGEFNITFGDTGDVYSVKKPSSFVRNLVAGSKYLEVVGDMTITNLSTDEKAIISFKEGSAWGGLSSRNKIEGKVLDSKGRTKVELVGRWDEHVDRKEGKDNYVRLWRIDEFPRNTQQYYGFSHFAAQLNELTSIEEGLLAPSDSRLRPDQRAMEDGDIDGAERMKKTVEEKQRSKRKEGREGKVPKWFKGEEEGWRYKGEYFEKREKKAFEDPDIFL
ncbi:oxysterol-binding protein [Pseudohyphozyma bogoriensis]|nr:oxysterol-binding protein [Pseudohyphozyma bogoriensis]